MQNDDDPDDEARQILEAEMAERERQIKHTETLEWARSRAAARHAAPVEETEHRSRRSAQPAVTAAWTAYVERQLDKRDRVHREHVATFAASVKHQLGKRDAEIAALETEVRQLRERLDTHERLAEITQRLDKLEASPRGAGLRAV